MKKALAILGDAWHAPSVIRRAIGSKLEDRGYSVDYVIDYDVPFDNLNDYDIIVLSRYAIDDHKRYKSKDDTVELWLTPEQEEKIEIFVSNGGKMFFHHDGISYYKKGNGISNVVKAFRIKHPPICSIRVSPVGDYEELNKGIEPYSIDDEEYYLEIDENQTNVFMESYSETNGRFIQGWFHDYGKGKVIVFIPGHDNSVFRHPMVEGSLNNIADWLTQ